MPVQENAGAAVIIGRAFTGMSAANAAPGTIRARADKSEIESLRIRCSPRVLFLVSLLSSANACGVHRGERVSPARAARSQLWWRRCGAGGTFGTFVPNIR